jgi:membrane-associated phospholipid phosphatase
MRAAVRRPVDAWTALAAIVATALAAWAVSPGTVGGLERSVFRFVNGWPDAWRPVLWVFQLLGLLGMPLLVAVVALVLRRWRLALALALLPLVKLVVEKDVLKALVRRERPGTTIPGAVLRHVPSAGPSFPSGHAIIAFGIAVLLLPYLRRRWQIVVVVLAVLNSVARVYLGGHAPLDVIGGAAAGIAVGALLSLLVGVQVARPRGAAHGWRTGRAATGAPTGPS